MAYFAISALVAGALFFIDPSGKLMGMMPEYLAASPFHSYLLPGLILFLLNGCMNVLAIPALLRSWKYAPIFVRMQGNVLLVWILIQVAMVNDFNALHAFMLLTGVVLIVLGFLLKFEK